MMSVCVCSVRLFERREREEERWCFRKESNRSRAMMVYDVTNVGLTGNVLGEGEEVSVD